MKAGPEESGTQRPAWQDSAPLQASPSLHGAPSVTGVLLQPASGSQLSVVQALPSSQAGGVPAAHVPATQVSAPLHASPSLHEEPSATATCVQPRIGSQESVVHGLPSSQDRAVPAMHVPPLQDSLPLQASPS